MKFIPKRLIYSAKVCYYNQKFMSLQNENGVSRFDKGGPDHRTSNWGINVKIQL